MRIGIDARLRAYRAGGISEHVSRLIEGFEILEPPEQIVVFEHRKAEGRPHALETRRLFTPPHHVIEGLTVPVELSRARLDVWHAVDVVVPRCWRGCSVATVHDVAFLRRPENLTRESRRYYNGVHRSVAQADRIIAVSEHTKRELDELTAADPARVRVIPNAVHPRYFERDRGGDARVLEQYGLAPGYVLFVSTIEPRKNVETLLRAVRRLLDEGRDVVLVLVGSDGWRSDGVYALAEELRLGERAQFLGYVPSDDLAALYRQARVLAHPAWDEGFGLTPVEAMAAGTPAIVANAGSLLEVVGKHALPVPPEDAAAWATALARVMDESDVAHRLVEGGRARAAGYTIERMALATLQVYQEAAEMHGLGSSVRGGDANGGIS